MNNLSKALLELVRLYDLDKDAAERMVRQSLDETFSHEDGNAQELLMVLAEFYDMEV